MPGPISIEGPCGSAAARRDCAAHRGAQNPADDSARPAVAAVPAHPVVPPAVVMVAIVADGRAQCGAGDAASNYTRSGVVPAVAVITAAVAVPL